MYIRTLSSTKSAASGAFLGAGGCASPSVDPESEPLAAGSVSPDDAGCAAGAEGSSALADRAGAPIALLYADFPGLGDRWESDTQRTEKTVAWAHAEFGRIVAAHGGALLPAPLDARSARFDSVTRAASAALSYRRAVRMRGELNVRVAIVAAVVTQAEAMPMPDYNRARLLAEGARPGECLLDAAASQLVTAEPPAGARLRRTLRSLPGLNRRERAMLLEDEDVVDGPSPGCAPLSVQKLRWGRVGLGGRPRRSEREGLTGR